VGRIISAVGDANHHSFSTQLARHSQVTLDELGDLRTISSSTGKGARPIGGIRRELRESARQTFDELIAQPEEALKASRESRRAFQDGLKRRWGQALDLFELTLAMALAIGHAAAIGAGKRSAQREALLRLHSRACLTASEIHALLRTGHATGAHGRWRTLHELAVVSLLIQQFGEAVAIKFWEHEVIKEAEDALAYQQHCERLGQKPYNEAELKGFSERAKAVSDSHDESFAGAYGWVAAEVRAQSGQKGRVTFEDLEQCAGIEHFRPYYRLASHAIHPSSKGVSYTLGLHDQREVRLAGPSVAGLPNRPTDVEGVRAELFAVEVDIGGQRPHGTIDVGTFGRFQKAPQEFAFRWQLPATGLGCWHAASCWQP